MRHTLRTLRTALAVLAGAMLLAAAAEASRSTATGRPPVLRNLLRDRLGTRSGAGLRVALGVLAATLLAGVLAVGASGALTFVGENVPVGDSPLSVVARDLNGDSAPDLVTANNLSNDVSVTYNDGDGGFGANVAYDVGDKPFAVVGDHLNGDSSPDLVVANNISNDVSVLLGDGSGTFGGATSYAAHNRPSALAVEDLNDDFEVDLVVTNAVSNDVSVLLGNGDGTFQTAVHYAVHETPTSVAANDLDDDGDVDLAVANRNTHDVSVLLGDGDGTFGAASHFAAHTGPSSVAAVRLNDDDWLDLAVANSDSGDVSVLLGNGDGTFDAAVHYQVGSVPRSLAAGFIDGDGTFDLAVANTFTDNVSVLLGNGDGTLGPAVHFDAHDSPSSVAVSDLTGDGRDDLAVANAGSDDVTVLLSTDVQSVVTLGASPASVPPGGTVTATWSGLEHTGNDWISLHPAGAPDGNYTTFETITGATGTQGLTAPDDPGTYELRLFSNGAKVATSNTFVVEGASGPSLFASPATVEPDGTVTVTWNGLDPAGNDWISMHLAGNPDESYITFQSISVASGDVDFTAPAAAGAYDFRLFRDGVKIATSNTVTVAGPAVTLSASPAAVNPGTSVTATWSNLDPSGNDWVSIHPAGAPDGDFTTFVTISGGSGSQPLTAPNAGGTYDLRLFRNGVKVATSDPFTVAAVTLTATPSTVNTGTFVTATWTNLVPTGNDWISLHPVGDESYTTFETITGAVGSKRLTAPSTPGTYVLRLYANGARVKTSDTFTVVAATLSAGSVANAGTSVTATWSNLVLLGSGMLSVHAVGAPDSSVLWWRWATTSAGSMEMLAPSTPGTYEIRLFNTFGTKVATSNPFTVVAATLSASPAVVSGGGQVTATWASLVPSGNDKVTLQGLGSRFPSASAIVSSPAGSVQLAAPAAPGAYELYLWRGSQLIARSNRITVSGVTMTASAFVLPGGRVNVRWLGLVPSGNDWISLHPYNAPDSEYTSFQKIGEAAGFAQLLAPATPGQYEARLFRNGLMFAESGVVEVSGANLSAAPTVRQPGDQILATWSSVGAGQTRISIHALSALDREVASGPVDIAPPSGQRSMLVPPVPGTYEMRLFVNGVKAATSNTFTVEAPVQDPPLAPSELHLANSTDSSITIAWDDRSNNETAFEVRYWPVSGGEAVTVHLVASTLQRTAPVEGYSAVGATDGKKKTWVIWRHTGLSFDDAFNYQVRACHSTCSQWATTLSAWARRQWDDPSNFTELDYGLYWFRCGRCRINYAGAPRRPMLEKDSTLVSRSDGIKAVPGENSEYYDPSKPTLIYVHGYQSGTTKRYFRESFNFTSASMAAKALAAGAGTGDYDLAGAWKARDWNVGIFYWNQFADEDGLVPFTAEAKIWTAGEAGGHMRWRRATTAVDAPTEILTSEVVTAPPSVEGRSAGDLFVQAVVDALGGNSSGDIRIAGHSLGNQMAAKMTWDLGENIKAGNVDASLLPQRVALLDPYYSPGWKSYLPFTGGPIGNNDAVAAYVTSLKEDGVGFEYYQTTGLSEITAGAVRSLAAYSRVHPNYESDPFAGAHTQGIYWYLMSMGAREPQALTCNWLGGCDALGSRAPSAATSNSRIRTLMNGSFWWEQEWGKNTATVGDDAFERMNK